MNEGTIRFKPGDYAIFVPRHAPYHQQELRYSGKVVTVLDESDLPIVLASVDQPIGTVHNERICVDQRDLVTL